MKMFGHWTIGELFWLVVVGLVFWIGILGSGASYGANSPTGDCPLPEDSLLGTPPEQVMAEGEARGFEMILDKTMPSGNYRVQSYLHTDESGATSIVSAMYWYDEHTQSWGQVFGSYSMSANEMAPQQDYELLDKAIELAYAGCDAIMLDETAKIYLFELEFAAGIALWQDKTGAFVTTYLFGPNSWVLNFLDKVASPQHITGITADQAST